MYTNRTYKKQTANRRDRTDRPHEIIFIDWHNTLSNAGFWHHWQETHPEYAQLIQGNFFANDVESTEQWMRGELSAEDVVTLLSKRIGIPEQVLFKGLRESAETLPLIDNAVMDLIKTIREAGIKTAIATDNMDTFLRWTVPALKLDTYFDDILDSHTRNALKADVDERGHSVFFHDYLVAENVRPEDAILFDDATDFADSFGLHYVTVTEDKPLRPSLEAYIRKNELE